MKKVFKRLISVLPGRYQTLLKKYQCAYHIRKGRFTSPEPEYEMLENWLSAGDWVIDVGANIGQYTWQMSKSVGANGRVFAFEPVPETFELLSSNVRIFRHSNVTLLNLAASDRFDCVGIDIPMFSSGLRNLYQAHLTSHASEINVISIPIDFLSINRRISLVKIDAEGHDFKVLIGMRDLIERDRPKLIVEDNSDQVQEFLTSFGYKSTRLNDSPNTIFSCSE